MTRQTRIAATLKCSYGTATSPLRVMPKSQSMIHDVLGPEAMRALVADANIMDHQPTVNIFPFGLCQCPANPAVIAATAAALGELTPMPCMPVVVAPWVPGSPVALVAQRPALEKTSKLLCAFGGVIEIVGA
jgi:hypothetical protein